MNINDRTILIQYICETYRNWKAFHADVVLTKHADGARTFRRWYVCFEGFEPTDMYLQSEHPSSDLQGQVITAGDCFD